MAKRRGGELRCHHDYNSPGRTWRQLELGRFRRGALPDILGLTQETRRSIRRVLKRFGAMIGPASPSSVRFVDIERFVAALQAKGLGPATVNKHLRHLSSAFTAAIDREYVERSPVRRRHFQRVLKKLIRVLSPAEQAALLAACPGEDWETFIHTLLHTGVRLNQLRPVIWDDLQLDLDPPGPSMKVAPQKGVGERRVPLVAETARRILRLKPRSMSLGGPFLVLGSTSTVQRMFRKIVARAGIKHCTLHDLRRTFCTRLAELDVNQTIVQTMAGHASPATTATFYQRINQDVQREAVERLARDMAG